MSKIEDLKLKLEIINQKLEDLLQQGSNDENLVSQKRNILYELRQLEATNTSGK